MTRLLLLPLLLLSFPGLLAQEQLINTENDKVSRAELNATVYSKDSTANAFYIFENGYSRFDSEGDHNLLTDYTAKIKILNQEGYDHANVEVRLYKGKNGKEKIRDIKATTYFLKDGVQQSHHLDPDKIYTEENPNYDIVKFTLPAVTPGAVLVYSYQKESPFVYKFEPWWFQADIPKMYSRYHTEIPGNYRYHIKLMGNQKLDTEENDVLKRCFYIKNVEKPADCMRSVYAMRDIPAFKEEKYLTSKYNYISRMEYELKEIIRTDGYKRQYTKTWDDVDKELRTDKELGRQLRKTRWVRNVLPESISALPNDLEKAKAIFDFVKNNYSWNGDYKIFEEVNVKNLLEEKTGNVYEMNILLHNLYKEQDFDVLPVLSSTRANGMPTKLYPVLSEFNYLMVQLQIGSDTYFLDATEKYADFGLLPFRTLNGYARLLDFDRGSSWIDLEPKEYSSIHLRDSLTVNPDGTMTGSSVHHFSGYHALSARKRLDELKPEEIFNALSNPNSHTRNFNTSLENKEVLSEEVRVRYSLHNESQKIDQLIYLNPFSFKFFNENPFKLKERNYPIDFGYKDAYTYDIRIQIPDDHEIVELPEQKLLRLPENGGSIHFITQQADEKTVNIRCRVTFPMAVYGSGYYPYLQAFFDAMMEIQEQSVILIRQKA